MLFNSYAFITLFFPLTFFLYFYISGKNSRSGIAWLAFASLCFYAYWNPVYTILILLSIGFNFWAGRLQEKCPSKCLLGLTIAADLALLGYFKYMDFFIANVNMIWQAEFPLLHIVLPLGISFFTFTQIAYLVSAYRGQITYYDGLSYILFVSYFPHLLAGPILHYEDMVRQFRDATRKTLNWQHIASGLFLFIIGLSKKVLIADPLGTWADAVFNNAESVNLSALEAWIGALSYTFQLYFDFSGYSDMAIGMSLMLNIRLPINFNSPYKAASIIDFWRRWHITLSTFLRDYLYIPFGGNRRGAIRKYANILLTMLLGGLWHGASWTFVLWGGTHGAALVLNHICRAYKIHVPKAIGIVLTFLFVNFAWVLFRADSFGQAMSVYTGMFNVHALGFGTLNTSLTLPFGRKESVVLFCLYVVLLFLPNSMEWKEKFRPNWQWSLVAAILFFAALLSFNQSTTFLYYQF